MLKNNDYADEITFTTKYKSKFDADETPSVFIKKDTACFNALCV